VKLLYKSETLRQKKIVTWLGRKRPGWPWKVWFEEHNLVTLVRSSISWEAGQFCVLILCFATDNACCCHGTGDLTTFLPSLLWSLHFFPHAHPHYGLMCCSHLVHLRTYCLRFFTSWTCKELCDIWHHPTHHGGKYLLIFSWLFVSVASSIVEVFIDLSLDCLFLVQVALSLPIVVDLSWVCFCFCCCKNYCVLEFLRMS
jgi:hypothetical protein